MTSALRKQLSRLSIWHRLLQDAGSRKLVRWAESQQLQIVSFRGARFYEAATAPESMAQRGIHSNPQPWATDAIN
jgi:hypothetical protein